MSSPTTVPPTSLLRLVPVLSSTASVTFCFTEYWSIIPLLQPAMPPESISTFWNSYLYQTMPGWIGFGLLSAATGFLGWKNAVGIPRTLYGWGTVLTLGHYAFGPTVAKIIEKIIYGPPEKVKGEARSWLKLHTARMILIDIPAMTCFIGAFVHMMT